ncbi:phage major capsid protein [Herbidospora mongoliensis]|uniref:phage major capsid protein n=1 Tax=Herbidospora mongoliensis TaxID=688067 RepID=UPI0008312BAE|nr:phage major capsid protein [Herbidospora mongoliensis]
MDINALKQKRGALVNEARALMEEVETAQRSMTGEEETKFDKLMADADGLERTITREEGLREQERRIAGANPPKPDPQLGQGTEQERQAAAFGAFLRGGRASLTPDMARALNMGNDPQGGYLVAPQQWVADLIQGLDDDLPFRELATVMQLTTGESLGVPTLDQDLTDAEWTTELATGSDDDSIRLGGRELSPNPIAKRVKISDTLLRKAAINPETLVRERLRYKFALTMEKAYMTGNGNKKPLGLFTASSQGISTNRDVTVGDISADQWDISPEGLIDAKYTLKAGYHTRARWLFHRNTIARIRKIRTDDGAGPGTGQFIWQPGLVNDRPPTILEVPYVLSEWVPSTYTDGSYVGMIGDFSYYWIVDALDMTVKRLVELYAEQNLIGFIGRLEGDGMPIYEEPFVRLKIVA